MNWKFWEKLKPKKEINPIARIMVEEHDTTCICGRVYKSNWSRCLRCGRETKLNIEEGRYV